MPATSLVYSVVAPAVLKKLVASSYPFRPADCRLLAVNVTHTYEVGDGDQRRALRLYCRGWRTSSEIAYELAALEHVAARGASVSAPIARRDGKLVTPVAAPEGVRPAVLFTWCDGVERVVDAAAARTYGESLARLHNASDDFVRRCPSRDIDLDCLVTRPLGIVLPADRPPAERCGEGQTRRRIDRQGNSPAQAGALLGILPRRSVRRERADQGRRDDLLRLRLLRRRLAEL